MTINTKELMSDLNDSFNLVSNHCHTMSKEDLVTSIRMLNNLYNVIYEDCVFAEHLNTLANITEEEEIARTESALWFEQGEKCYEIDQ